MTLAMLLTATSSRGDAVSLWNVLQYQLTNASQNAEAPTVITLDCDYVADSSDERLIVPQGRHAIIDLNGHTIDRNLSEETSSGYVIVVGNNSSNTNPASLVIRDTQGGGIITGGYTSGSCGGINVNGILTLEGGTICGNKSKNNAAGISVNGTFNMTGGSIINNTNTGTAGNGSAIWGSTSYSHINISGGTITGNKGKNAIYVTGSLSLNGTYDLSGNTLADGTTDAPDIMLFDSFITINGALNPAHPAIVGQEGNNLQPAITSGWSTYMSTKRPSDYFVARAYDIANGKIVGLLDDELVLSTPEVIYWHADSDHDGTSEEKAYIITNAWGLEYLATYVNGGNNTSHMYFKLGADIDMSGINHFTPIGFGSDKVFRGYFDGQDYTISGLTINQPNDSYVGLFGHVVNGVVQNVILSDANISGHNYVGGIVGYITNSTIQNCFVINSSISSAGNSAAAIVGNYDNYTKLRYNYYHNCKVTKHSTEYTSGIGTNTGDVNTSSNIHGAKAVLALADNADNSSVIANKNGNTIGVYLEGRTLYRDGDWNTLCLPFQASLSNSPLAGAEAREFTGSSFDSATGTLNLTFSEPVTGIYPGYPYIIRWPAAATNIVNPLFRGVSIYKFTHNTETDYVDFVSTYDPIVWETENKSILFLSANNTLYYPQSGISINAFRAYFKLKGLEASPNPSQGGGHAVREFVMSFDDEDTGIRPTPNPSQNGGEWYNLQGRKLAGKPTKAGLYIYKGKLVAIK